MIQMISTALELNDQNRLVALLWHQGETDAELSVTFDEHYKNLMTFVRSVREAFKVPRLPFIAGDFVPYWKSNHIEISAPVADAIKAVCNDCKCGSFVETDGLLSNCQQLDYNPLGWRDTVHFSRKSVYELGKRYYEAFVNLMK
jgi:hypothetical protein